VIEYRRGRWDRRTDGRSAMRNETV